MKRNQTLIVLQGTPACGKSTKAAEWQATDPVNRVIVSRDALRHARGQYWVPEQEEFITKVEGTMVRHALACGLDVIIDATNFNPAYLYRWDQIVEEHEKKYPDSHVRVEHWMVHEHLATCLLRDGNPDRPHHVGEDVICAFHKKYHAYCHRHNINIEYGTVTKTLIKE